MPRHENFAPLSQQDCPHGGTAESIIQAFGSLHKSFTGPFRASLRAVSRVRLRYGETFLSGGIMKQKSLFWYSSVRLAVFFLMSFCQLSLFAEKPLPEKFLIPVTNGNFEAVNPENQNAPLHWSQDHSPTKTGLRHGDTEIETAPPKGDTEAAKAIIKLNGDKPHGGKLCLTMNHNFWNQSTMVSQPLNLKVGHLYRLSGWIKTSGAYTNIHDRYPTPLPPA